MTLILLQPLLRRNGLATMNSLSFVRVAAVYLFSRSLYSCHRSYVRRSLSNIINVLHLSPLAHEARGDPDWGSSAESSVHVMGNVMGKVMGKVMENVMENVMGNV